MKTSTIKFQRIGKPAKFIPNACDYKGFLVKAYKKGTGKSEEIGFMSDGEGDSYTKYERYDDKFLPYFDTDKMTPDELATIKKAEYRDVEDVIKAGLQHTLILFAGTESYTVIDADVAKTNKIIEDKIVYFDMHHCWETGLYYYELRGKYPTEVFATMKPELSYHSEEFEEEGNWKGWYTHNLEKIEEKLKPISWTCK